MKALILAGGRGKRLDELSIEQNKCMIEINGIHVIEFSLEYLCSTSIKDAIIVVGYKAEEIINHYGNSFKNLKISYVIQWEQKGLVHAIECAKEAINGDDFMLLLGDELLINPKHNEMLEEFNKEDDLFAVCGVLLVKDMNYIKRTYTLIHDGNNRIYRLIEKPRSPLNNIMGTGSCVFRNDIFKYIDVTPVHHERNEKELPDLIQCAIDDGKYVKLFHIGKDYVNINDKKDIEMANKMFKTKN